MLIFTGTSGASIRELNLGDGETMAVLGSRLPLDVFPNSLSRSDLVCAAGKKDSR